MNHEELRDHWHHQAQEYRQNVVFWQERTKTHILSDKATCERRAAYWKSLAQEAERWERMELIDNVFGLDWSQSKYVGDGVYVMDASVHAGVASVAVRTDGESTHHVIIFEEQFFEDLVTSGRAILAHYNNARRLVAQQQRKEGTDVPGN